MNLYTDSWGGPDGGSSQDQAEKEDRERRRAGKYFLGAGRNGLVWSIYKRRTQSVGRGVPHAERGDEKARQSLGEVRSQGDPGNEVVISLAYASRWC